MAVYWNPWYGCQKMSEGCKNCYVHRGAGAHSISVSIKMVRRNDDGFDVPIRRRNGGAYKMYGGQTIYTCHVSDFFIPAADKFRQDAWNIIKERHDLKFVISTKRVDCIRDRLPSDWNGGYQNVIVVCSVENQDSADKRLPVFMQLPIARKAICVSPILEQVDLRKYIVKGIEYVSASGETGLHARLCDFDWILNLRTQCVRRSVPFEFHQTGEFFVFNQRRYKVDIGDQMVMARGYNADYKPEGSEYGLRDLRKLPLLF